MTRSAVAARLSLVALLAAALLVTFAVAASAQSAGSAEDRMTSLINAERRSAGLRPLSTNVQLTGVARGWTPTMVRAGKLSHNPNLASQVTGSWTRLGENVGVARPGTNESADAMVDRLHRAFMASPGHRANVLGDYEQVGLGAIWDRGALWITVNFMKGGETRPNASVGEAASMSRRVFADAGASGRRAEYAVLGRAEVFADALGGSGLAADRGPMLFTNGPTDIDRDPALHSAALAEIDRVLGGRGTVYLLGGTGAVSARVERELAAAGYTPRRLSGPSRVETAVRVAEEIVRVHGAPKRVLVARADDWPDAVTGGAYAAAARIPLVLTGRDDLHPATARFLAAHGGAEKVALGGGAALSDRVVGAANARRVSGADRAATAVAVAEQLWGRTAAKPGDRFAMAPGWTGDAWSYALAMAPWSAAFTGPQLLVSDQLPPAVDSYLRRLGYSGSTKGDVLAASAVPAAVRDQVVRLLNG
jgi:uncharacterized protein YkwD